MSNHHHPWTGPSPLYCDTSFVGEASGHQSVISESDKTPIVKNTYNTKRNNFFSKDTPEAALRDKNPFLPPSRRVDSGDDEISPDMCSNRGSVPRNLPDGRTGSLQRHETTQSQLQGKAMPSPQKHEHQQRSIQQEEASRTTLLFRGESNRSFFSAASYRSGHSRAGSMGSSATPSPRRRLDRAESTKSFSSELDHYVTSLTKSTATTGSVVSSNASMNHNRTPTPPELLRNITQSSARRMIVQQQQQGAQNSYRSMTTMTTMTTTTTTAVGTKNSSPSKLRHEDTAPVWRPDNPVATQLRYQLSSASSCSVHSGILMTTNILQEDGSATAFLMEMNAPQCVNHGYCMDQQLSYPTTGCSSPKPNHSEDDDDMSWNPTGTNFVAFRRASM